MVQDETFFWLTCGFVFWLMKLWLPILACLLNAQFINDCVLNPSWNNHVGIKFIQGIIIKFWRFGLAQTMTCLKSAKLNKPLVPRVRCVASRLAIRAWSTSISITSDSAYNASGLRFTCRLSYIYMSVWYECGCGSAKSIDAEKVGRSSCR